MENKQKQKGRWFEDNHFMNFVLFFLPPLSLVAFIQDKKTKGLERLLFLMWVVLSNSILALEIYRYFI